MVGALGETSDSHQTRSRHSEVPLGSLDWVRWKCEAAINKPIHKQIHPAFTQWEPLSLRPPSNSIYAFSHSLTSQQPEINSGLSNPNLSPFPLIGVGQAPGLCSKEMQPRDTGPALTFCGNILRNPEASLYHMTRNIHINFSVHWLKHLVSTLLRSFWNENTSSVLVDNKDQEINNKLCSIGDNVLISHL